MREGTPAPQARINATTLIENVHVFARNYTDDDLGAPSNHAIIFDEAQRAWNKAQNLKKFKRDYSEPEMLLKIMERHSDWAVVVALVGGGQEINDGEAGLEEWGRALGEQPREERSGLSTRHPRFSEGGASTAGHRLFEDDATQRHVETNSSLHLRTSNRSLRAEQLATWVNYVLDGNSQEAASLEINKRFPMFLSRDIEETRRTLKQHRKGLDRQGLVGSSGAARLRAEGLEPNSTFHADYPWEHWYLADETDIRSSYRCEVFATEFEIQGLELDWIGLCWGGDFIWDGQHDWQLRTLRHGSPSKWSSIKSPDKRTYRRNAYRVLLTATRRKGMVLFVPRGDPNDPTNSPAGVQRDCGLSGPLRSYTDSEHAEGRGAARRDRAVGTLRGSSQTDYAAAWARLKPLPVIKAKDKYGDCGCARMTTPREWGGLLQRRSEEAADLRHLLHQIRRLTHPISSFQVSR